MREIEVDRLDAEPLQRRVARLFDIGRRETLLAGPHGRTDLGDDDDAVARAARLYPFADDRLGFAALVARRPGRIDVGRIDRVEAGFDEAIQQLEGPRLVRRPAEYIAAKDQR